MNEVWTIGHSTRSLEDFLAVLGSFQIEVLADIRRFPNSRRHPHFGAEELRKGLFHAGIRYEYLGDELGGFRKPVPGSPHLGLAGSSFQGYADHLSTAQFLRGLSRLKTLAAASRVAYMCSERQPKSCHRKILSDLLVSQGLQVHHILDPGESTEHVLSKAARLVEGFLVYAPTSLEEFAPDPSGEP